MSTGSLAIVMFNDMVTTPNYVYFLFCLKILSCELLELDIQKRGNTCIT